MKQPFHNIILYDEELERYLAFDKKHLHMSQREASIEESCAPNGPYELHYENCSIGHTWIIKCTYCDETDDLSQDCDW